MHDGSLPSILGVLSAYWYASCWTVTYEFFQTLFTDPSGIFLTRAILEISVGYNNCLALMSSAYNILVAYCSNPIGQLLLTVGGLFADWWNSSVFYLIGILKGS